MNLEPGDYIVDPITGTVLRPDGSPVSLTDEQARIIAEMIQKWWLKPIDRLSED